MHPSKIATHVTEWGPAKVFLIGPADELLCQTQHFRNDLPYFLYINFPFDHDQSDCLRCRNFPCGVAL